ncbi:MAG TPA: carbonic anhydrase family protein, partial [Iamia sp.]|nr:carbonic anhydrase family protein [Iamia sp.]
MTPNIHAPIRRSRWGAAAVLAVALLVASGCSDGDDDEATSADEGTETTEAASSDDTDTTTTEAEAEEEHEDPHFTYEGEDGPEHWAELSDEWATCGAGTEQSPIDLTEAAEAGDADLPDIVFDYQPSGVALVDNGHTVQGVYDPGSGIELGGTRYELLQFHFHAHSEHTIDGATTPLEIHFVHQAEDESLAVVGVLIQEGAENPAYATIMDNLPAEVTEEPVPVDGATINAAAMLPEDSTFFHYAGSLTTPPCSEGVSWQVMTTTIELSAEQIAAFTDHYAN